MMAGKKVEKPVAEMADGKDANLADVTVGPTVDRKGARGGTSADSKAIWMVEMPVGWWAAAMVG